MCYVSVVIVINYVVGISFNKFIYMEVVEFMV